MSQHRTAIAAFLIACLSACSPAADHEPVDPEPARSTPRYCVGPFMVEEYWNSYSLMASSDCLEEGDEIPASIIRGIQQGDPIRMSVSLDSTGDVGIPRLENLPASVIDQKIETGELAAYASAVIQPVEGFDLYHGGANTVYLIGVDRRFRCQVRGWNVERDRPWRREVERARFICAYRDPDEATQYTMVSTLVILPELSAVLEFVRETLRELGVDVGDVDMTGEE